MTNLNTKLFARIMSRNGEVYALKIITLSIAFASSILIILFSINEFGYDRFYKDPNEVFRILQRNTDEQYNGNRLSVRIPSAIINDVRSKLKSDLIISRVKIMNGITVVSGDQTFADQKIHAVDPSINEILSLDIINGTIENFNTGQGTRVLLSSKAAIQYTGSLNSAGKRIQLYSFGDTIKTTVAAVFNSFPGNSHEDFDVLIAYNPSAITTLSFDPDQTGVYGRASMNSPEQLEDKVNHIAMETNMIYKLQPLREIYFGPRVVGEDARHGDSYSVIILISIAGLILFLALTSFINLTTLTLPNRSKELAVKKLAGVSPETLLYIFVKESFALVGISLSVGLLILIFTSTFIEPLLGLQIAPLLLQGNAMMMLAVTTLFIVVSISPVFMTFRFIRATPNQLLSTDRITFPKFKRVITCLQLGISIFLIAASVVVRRQINYSLLKEPGRNHDQVVYLHCPSGITSDGISSIRSNWKIFNPNIVDVMAVSQLPDRISSKVLGSDINTLLVDRGFRDFFDFKMEEGNWFKANDGDSIVIINKKGKDLIGKNHTNVIGVIQDFNGQFNQPERPIKIRIAPDYNYNWLCVRVLEVDIRRTVNKLSDDFSSGDKKADIHFLNKNFECWLNYQDHLNALSDILAVISVLLSCCAIYGLSISLLRDKLKQMAVHKLCGAQTVHLTQLLLKDFARQMLIALLVFGPLTYLFLHELLRSFAYSTKFTWLDPVYPIAYCTFIIVTICGAQALSLNKSDLTSALK